MTTALIILIGTIVTYVIYRASKVVYKKWPMPFFHPLLLCPLILIGIIQLSHLQPSDYALSSSLWTHMLGPATVAFAIPIYKHAPLLRKNIMIILTSIATGTLVAIGSSLLLSLVMRFNGDLLISILPRSITTPIAIEVSKTIGGLPTLTTVFVIVTGVTGGIIGPYVIRLMALKSPVARGLALGMGAHGVGTNKAMEYGEQEGTFSTIGMIMAAAMTLVWGGLLIPSLLNITIL
ncbi:LrgB family protein [Terribacillus saccharophilus]|uniref:LrgB family protein n=1 Tax=Terribacillus saccharophilus TaxID=361277 RepID=UPI002DD3953A|nr:LrgB family protein [Terribacillus saccharophilus]